MLPKCSNIPQPDPSKFPEVERADCIHLAGNLKALDHFRLRYGNAMILVCECNEAYEKRPSAITQIDRPDLRFVCADDEMREEWRKIAFRDAANTIYHFSFVLDGLIKCVYRCPTLMKSVDLAKLKTAQPIFERYFPKAARMRNAVAHSGEFLHSPAKLAKNELFYSGKIDLGGWVIGEVAMQPTGSITTGFRFYATYRGDAVLVELSPAKHDQMVEILSVVYSAFSAHAPPT